MNFFIRTNISKEIGIGHLVRVMRLGDKLKKLGHKCWFFIDHVPKSNLKIFKLNNNYLVKYDLETLDKIDEYYIINDNSNHAYNYFSVDSVLYYQIAHKIFSIKPNTKWE